MPEAASTDGYLRYPAIGGGTVVFVCEDDLWSVPAEGGTARRLTADLARIDQPAICADGKHIAFTSDVEGAPEVYVMPAQGGPARRRSWLGDATTRVRGFTPAGEVLFTSAAGQPFRRLHYAYTVSPGSGPVRRLAYGPVGAVAFGPNGSVVLGRNTADPARWKRYRGGTAGKLWIDPDGSGTFHRLLADLDGNLASPLWIGDRIYFLSDHEGIGNIYSVAPDGGEPRRHTHHDTYYARWATSDGRRIAYQHAGELWLLDPQDAPRRLDVRLAGPRTQRTRRFVAASEHLGDAALHPHGHSLVADVRGKLVTMPCWEEAATQHGAAQGVRYRLGRFLGAGDRVAVVSDADGEDGIDIVELAPGQEGRATRLAGGGALGRVRELAPAPNGGTLAVTNQRRQLLAVDVAHDAVRVIDEAPGGLISGPAWSPDGAYLAYSYPVSPHRAGIRIAHVASGEVHEATTPEFVDEAPSFDPDGRYLYFLSRRIFNPVSDRLQFDLGFPKATRPYLMTLRADVESPFVPKRRPLTEKDEDKEKPEAPPVTIDFDGIERRVVAFPVSEERYAQVIGLGEKVLLVSGQVEGELDWDLLESKPPELTIAAYDLKENERTVLVEKGGPVTVSADHKTMLYRSGSRVRVLKAGEEAPTDVGDEPGRKSGWVDIDRIRVAVDPAAEWPQMLAEAWRLQRDHFWVPDMSGIDWPAILRRYEPLAERVATRAEFSDVMWEMQGELGTSHAYELGGDYRPTASWGLGQLGADLERDETTGRWRITRVAAGDSWDEKASSPLAAPGLGVGPGDTLLAVGGQPVDPESGPGPLLVHQAGQAVELTVATGDGTNPRRITVKARGDERPARYREWVAANRARVHDASRGRVGYLHVPDMTPDGFAEFHRGYLSEHERDALIVDIRFNGGGNVSALLLEKLARRRIAYDVSRWLPPEPYPPESPAGPLVCLTNEQAGSDGDIFTHGFSLLGLGTVVGTRTWGGVIGISGDARLADGTMTTQPEFAFWFSDVGWGIENRGAEPDVERDIAPHEYAAGADPQLDAALEIALRELASHEPVLPDPSTRPHLAPAPLPVPETA